MAGIGWKLERMLERGTLTSTLQAYLTGVAVTSAPWLLTTAVLVTLRALSQGGSSVEFAHIEFLITLAYSVTLVLSAPVHVVMSRYAADRLYEQRLDLVSKPLRQALAITLLAAFAIGGIIMAIAARSISLAIPGTILTAIIAAQWLLLGVGGGMSAPLGVLRAFVTGAFASVVAAVLLERVAGLGARGFLIGFTFGQSIALVLMLVRILHDLPAQESPIPPGSIRQAFRDYRLLALSSLFVYLAVWIDKICAWLLIGPDSARMLSSATALAWFAVIPAFAWIYVQVETAFYRVFRQYYRGIASGARLDELEASADQVRIQAARLLRGTVSLQLVILVLAELGAPHLTAALGLPDGSTVALQLALIGASLQVVTLLGLLLLYYLDLRREACIVAAWQLVGVTLGTIVCIAFGAPAALGAALGAFLPACRAVWTVRRMVSTLVPDTFQSQSFGW